MNSELNPDMNRNKWFFDKQFKQHNDKSWRRLSPQQREFLQSFDANQNGDCFSVQEGSAHATIIVNEQGIYLSMIETTPSMRKQGHASMLLTKICEIADKTGVVISLKVEPKGIVDLDQTQLKAWYQRSGFVGKAEKMVRKPNSQVE